MRSLLIMGGLTLVYGAGGIDHFGIILEGSGSDAYRQIKPVLGRYIAT